MAKKKGAVAISYTADDTAPRILAKGERLLAEKILKSAEDSGVPVVEDEYLWSLLSREELGSLVPESSWVAIAAILAFTRKAGEQL